MDKEIKAAKERHTTLVMTLKKLKKQMVESGYDPKAVELYNRTVATANSTAGLLKRLGALGPIEEMDEL